MARYTWAPAKNKSGIKVTDTLKNEAKAKADSLINRSIILTIKGPS